LPDSDALRGHYGVLFGAALGAEVTVFSRSDAKKSDALEMGASRFVAMTPGFERDLQRDLDLIIVTASSSQLPLDELLFTLAVEKKLVFVGMPESGLPNVRSQTLSGNAVSLSSSHLGNKTEVIQMLELAAEKGINPWINVLSMKDAAKAIKAIENNSVRYRSVLLQVSPAAYDERPQQSHNGAPLRPRPRTSTPEWVIWPSTSALPGQAEYIVSNANCCVLLEGLDAFTHCQYAPVPQRDLVLIQDEHSKL
jgi:alcohol dehydrogenase (NADP+)